MSRYREGDQIRVSSPLDPHHGLKATIAWQSADLPPLPPLYAIQIGEMVYGGYFEDNLKPLEAACRSCGRPNDDGVKVCWCCGGVP